MTSFPLVARRSARGFTLIELLTVIAIIGILAAIIIPTVGKVRQSAKSAQCLSNMRQIGMAFNLYPQDNKGFYPRTTNNVIPGAASTGIWAKALNAYLPAKPTGSLVVIHPVFLCPSDENQPDGSSTGSVLHYLATYALERTTSVTAPNAGPRLVQEIVLPSKTFLLVDAKVDPTTKSATDTACPWSKAETDRNLPEASRTSITFRHNEIMNTLFFDGHTEKLTLAAFNTAIPDTATGVRLWNGK